MIGFIYKIFINEEVNTVPLTDNIISVSET